MTPGRGDVPILGCERRPDGVECNNLLEELKAISAVNTIVKVGEGRVTTGNCQQSQFLKVWLGILTARILWTQ
jgi:hypothetical protein